jgi:ERF superfamily
MKVYKAINGVQAELSVLGITKNRRNTQGSGYNFRGIDDVYNAIAPLLSKYGLCILPRVLSRECVERISKSGGALFYVTVDAEFDFVSSEDGSKHTVKTFGEAMDSGDKATNKAMSAAYKYACFQAFSIPTEADNDADAHTHTPTPKVSATKTDLVPSNRMAVIADVAAAINERMSANDVIGAVEEYAGIVDIEEKTALWAMLDSKTRSSIKKQAELMKG